MRKITTILILMFVSSLVFAGQFDLKIKPGREDAVVKQVIVKVTLPDKKDLTAVVSEGSSLKITIGDKYYVFEPRAIDLEGKSAFLENTYASASAGDIEDFQFEILDIISVPLKNIRSLGLCDTGTCCVTCGNVTACACGVFDMTCGQCCCPGCCKQVR